MLALALLAMSPGLAELPPDVQADLHLIKAERQIGEGDYKGAAATLDKILVLQREHGFEIPPLFWLKHASVLLETGDIDQAERSAVRYIEATGREGERYVEVLELLDQVGVEREERARRTVEAERRRRDAATGSCAASGIFRHISTFINVSELVEEGQKQYKPGTKCLRIYRIYSRERGAGYAIYETYEEVRGECPESLEPYYRPLYDRNFFPANQDDEYRMNELELAEFICSHYREIPKAEYTGVPPQ